MKNDSIETCIIYSRVSTEKQKNDSQISDLRSYAKYMKFKIIKVYEETISGSIKTSNRLSFKELLNFIDQNDVDHILVWELSRLGRNLIDILDSIELFTEKKINVFSKKENLNTLNADKSVNETTRMTLAIMGSVAQYERTMIVERSKRGLRDHIKKGGSWSLPPYGYRSVNKKIAIDPNESLVVKKIYKLFISGMASPSIAKHLNLEKIKTKKGTHWNDVQVRDILHNTMYYGKRKYSSGIVDVPAIVSESDHLKAQQIFNEHRNLNKDKAVYTNYLSGLIKCAECGSPYFQHARRSKKDFAYKCLSQKKFSLGQIDKKCDNRGININLLNSMVYYAIFAILVEYISGDGLAKLFSKIKNDQEEKLKNIEREIRIVKNEIDKGEKKSTRLSDLLLRDVLSEADYLKNKDEITKSLEKYVERLNSLLIEVSNIQPNDTYYISSLRRLAPKIKKQGIKSVADKFQMEIEEYRNLIKKFILSITISKGTAEENKDLANIIPPIHQKRITKISINSTFKVYTFYTVSGFNKYSYHFDDNKNFYQVGIVPEYCQ